MKKLLAALLAMTICLSFAACGNSGDDEKDTGNTRKSESSVPQTEASEEDKPKSEKKQEASEADSSSADKEETSSAEEENKKGSEKEEKEEKKETKKKKKKKKSEESDLPVGYENDVYTIRFDTNKWVDAKEFMELIASAADEYSFNIDISDMLDGMYYYADDADKDYPSNILFIAPSYDASIASMNITDEGIADSMIQMVDMQMNAQDGFSITDSGIVNRGGRNWLRIQVQADFESMHYNCDEYILFKNGYCIIASVNYADENSPAKTDFEKMLDNIEFK